MQHEDQLVVFRGARRKGRPFVVVSGAVEDGDGGLAGEPESVDHGKSGEDEVERFAHVFSGEHSDTERVGDDAQ